MWRCHPLVSPPRRPVNADFVTWRGHLTKVLTTPYESQEGWLLAVSLFRGTLYVSEVETPAARQQREQRSDMLQELAYMGYKFERYMCAELGREPRRPVPVPPDTPDGSPDPTGVVNTNEAFCTVVRTRLGSHSLLFAGEVDCADPRGAWPEPPACYVELKTCKELHSPAQRRSFYRYKLIKWWAQSFLPGVSRIVAGFRAPDGSVATLETFETMKIFQLIRTRAPLCLGARPPRVLHPAPGRGARLPPGLVRGDHERRKESGLSRRGEEWGGGGGGCGAGH
nr:decapping and exoribonuclease protein isoform X2 [Caretta caretta]